MEVNPLQAGNGINGNLVSSGEVSQETFLLLLTAQLQNQDPLEPAEDVEFIQQLATFAQLEQQQITNQNLSVLQLYQNSLNNSNALNIVGKDVKVQDSELQHEPGQTHTLYYDSDSDASALTISVVDANGREVYTQSQVGAPDGEQVFTWNGQDNDGNNVEAGDYRVRVFLEDAEGTRFPSGVYQAKRVDGIAYENGAIMLLVGDRKIPIENVIEVYEPGALADGSSTGESTIDFRHAAAMGDTPLAPYANMGKARAAYLPYQSTHPFQVIPGGR